MNKGLFSLYHYRSPQLSIIVCALTIVIGLGMRIYASIYAIPALYWEEVALGYDTYSLIQTGRDHHNNPWPLVAIESFGDWKPPAYIYVLAPFVAMWGLQDWVIRIPSVMAGLAIMIGVGEMLAFFSQRYNFPYKKWSRVVGISITALSPWAIHFSSAGWEANLATALLLWASILILRASQIKTNTQIDKQTLNKSKQLSMYWKVVIAVILLLTSMYTYHSARVIAPILGGILALWWLQEQYKHGTPIWEYVTEYIKDNTRLLITVCICILLGLLPFFYTSSQLVSLRFAQTSIFSEISIIEESNYLKEISGNSFISRLFYHRYVLFARQIAENFFSHFTIDFLFINGDSNPRHSVQYMGHLYVLDGLFLLVGIVVLLNRFYKRDTMLLLGWLMLAIFPASLTVATPHALRILPSLPIFLILISFGVLYSLRYIQEHILRHIDGFFWKRKITQFIIAVSICVYFVQPVAFWRFYTQIYPTLYGSHWQYGYKQMIALVKAYQKQHPTRPVYITREQGRPAMYYLFYTQQNPLLTQSLESTARQDMGEILELEQIYFINSLEEVVAQSALIVSSATEMERFTQEKTHMSKTQEVGVVTDLTGNTPVWVLKEYQAL